MVFKFGELLAKKVAFDTSGREVRISLHDLVFPMRPGLDHVASMCDHLVGAHYGRNTYMGVVNGTYLGPGPTGPRLILVEFGHGLIAQGLAHVDSVRFAAVRRDFDRWAALAVSAGLDAVGGAGASAAETFAGRGAVGSVGRR